MQKARDALRTMTVTEEWFIDDAVRQEITNSVFHTWNEVMDEEETDSSGSWDQNSPQGSGDEAEQQRISDFEEIIRKRMELKDASKLVHKPEGSYAGLP
jgi:hypothetical protein